MRESSVSLNWVLEELCSVLTHGTLLFLLDACQTSHHCDELPVFDPARIVIRPRCVMMGAQWLHACAAECMAVPVSYILHPGLQPWC
jgi:hypothetical protein